MNVGIPAWPPCRRQKKRGRHRLRHFGRIRCLGAARSRRCSAVAETAARPGGHTATVDIDYDGQQIAVDTGFIVYNGHNYPDLTALFAHLGVETHASNMGLSLWLDDGRMSGAARLDIHLRAEAQPLLTLLSLDAARVLASTGSA